MGKKLKIEGSVDNIKIILCKSRNDLGSEKNDRNMINIGHVTDQKSKNAYFIYAKKVDWASTNYEKLFYLKPQEKEHIQDWFYSVIPQAAKNSTIFNFYK